jgi:hypothetical protein
MKRKYLLLALVLFALPLAAQQNSVATPQLSIRAQRNQIAAGRRELKLSIKLQRAAVKEAEARIRVGIALRRLGKAEREDAARVAAANRKK